jgi:flagellar secretion chaperone FliS
MSTYAPQSHSTYRANAVLTASPEQLVVALYDGAHRFLHQASVAMTARDIQAAHVKQKRAEDIIRHLRNTLDMDQGEIAERLYAIYTFCLEHLRKARLEQDPRKVDEVDAMLAKLRTSWAAIAHQ